jgi:hypothetical protein
MALYLLSYDLRKDRDYQTLYDELDQFKAVRVLESCWCFKRFNTNAEGLRDYFKKFIDKDDGLWVSQIAEDKEGFYQWAGYMLDGNPNKL